MTTIAQSSTNYRRKMVLAAALVFLPALIFYAVLFHYCVNIPSLDDYDAGLSYLNQSVQIPTRPGRFLYLLAAQQNEYKIVFGHAIVWSQYALLGNVDFRLTCILGDLFVLPLGWLLWKMFLPTETNLARRLALFLPVSLLLFQLNYTETLNWALPGLQNVTVVFFSLMAIYLLVKPSKSAFWGAIAMLVLAISASGNGFLIVPIGVLVLVIDRHHSRIAIWLMTTAICIAGYAYHYNLMSSQSSKHHSIAATLLHLNPAYIFIFVGAEFFHPIEISAVAGLSIVLYFAYLVRRGYWRKNPTTSYCVLFLSLTSVAVAAIRSELGLTSATSSRYRIYSDLFLIFVWSSFVQEFLQPRREALIRSTHYRVALGTAAILFLIGDIWGFHFLNMRDHRLVLGMALYEHPQPLGPTGPALPPSDNTQWQVFANHARGIMDQSTQLHIYHPPNY
jgi:hypothetical protein